MANFRLQDFLVPTKLAGTVHSHSSPETRTTLATNCLKDEKTSQETITDRYIETFVKLFSYYYDSKLVITPNSTQFSHRGNHFVYVYLINNIMRISW